MFMKFLKNPNKKNVESLGKAFSAADTYFKSNPLEKEWDDKAGGGMIFVKLDTLNSQSLLVGYPKKKNKANFKKNYKAVDAQGNIFFLKQEDAKDLERQQKNFEQQKTALIAMGQFKGAVVVEQGDKKIFYTATEFKSGKSLYDKVWPEDLSGERIKQTLKKKEALLLAIRLARELDAMHQKEIIHGDLNPKHIMCETKKTASGLTVEVSIVDYGASIQTAQKQSVMKQKRGREYYRAPEVNTFGGDLMKKAAALGALDLENIDKWPEDPVPFTKASDIYSFGKMLNIDLGLSKRDFPIVAQLLYEKPKDRPTAIKALEALLSVLKERPLTLLDQKTVELIIDTEAYLAQRMNTSVSEVMPFQQEKMNELIAEANKAIFQENHFSDDPTKNFDEKSIDLKAALLKNGRRWKANPNGVWRLWLGEKPKK